MIYEFRVNSRLATGNMVQRISLPPRFIAKKDDILSHLALDPEAYQDKSPKGSVDVQILDLIRLINSIDGWVTTSSCAGRVAVFVEGPKKAVPVPGSTSKVAPRSPLDASINGDPGGWEDERLRLSEQIEDHPTVITKSAPGGKGGGHWLYVSHDSLPRPTEHADAEHWTGVFGLARPPSPENATAKRPRLVHLSFSPLILHVLCATLQHARPLLSAAINAGFRESGVQSLKALDPHYVGEGVMVAIRTNGIVFETTLGIWDEAKEAATTLVPETYLQMCADVINERFEWNAERKERLVRELQLAIRREGWTEIEEIETKEQRRDRKRKEGLERQQALQASTSAVTESSEAVDKAEEIDLQGLDIG